MAASTLNSLASPAAAATRRLPMNSLSAANPMGGVGFYLTLLYIFMLIGRTPEITSALLGFSFYQILILDVVLLTLAIVTGEFVRVAASRSGVWWVAFHLWVLFTLPFSGYRRGSFESLQPALLLSLSVIFLGGFLVQKPNGLRKGVWAMAWAGLLALGWIQFTGISDESDRFQSTGSFGNSNLLAIYMLVLVPFWGFIVVNRRYSWFSRLLFMGAIGLGLISVLRTGSRSGLMTIAVLAIPAFISMKMIGKFAFVVVAVVAVLGVMAYAPASVKKRWETMINNDEKTDQIAESARVSADARYALLRESLEETMKHPFLGVGIGVYADVVAGENQSKGERSLWQVTHNMYTQVSAETGIPGFILYFTAMFLSIQGVWRVMRKTRKDPALNELTMIAGAVLCAWLVFCFNGFFTSMATEITMYVLVGFSIATAATYSQIAALRVSSAGSGSAEANRAPVRNSRFFPSNPTPSLPVPASEPAAGIEVATVPNSDAPWRRNPRKYPPKPGSSLR